MPNAIRIPRFSPFADEQEAAVVGANELARTLARHNHSLHTASEVAAWLVVTAEYEPESSDRAIRLAVSL